MKHENCCDYDELAPNYDNVRGADEEYVMYWTSQLAAHSDLESTSMVLDIGCGTGRYAEAYASSGTRRVFGLDLSRQMLVRARAKISSKNLFWLQGSCVNLPFKAELFNAAFSVMVIHHIPHDSRSEAYRQVLRILDKDGKFIILTRTPDQIKDSLITLFPGVYEIDSKRMPGKAELESGLSDAGFSSVEFNEIPNYSMYRSRERFLNRVESKYISTLTLFDDDIFRSNLATFKKRLEERFGNAEELYDPMEFTLVKAIK
jgi:SAM-dependent methyltransferase